MSYRFDVLYHTAVDVAFHQCKDGRVRWLYLPRRTREFRRWSVYLTALHRSIVLRLSRRWLTMCGYPIIHPRMYAFREWVRRYWLIR